MLLLNSSRCCRPSLLPDYTAGSCSASCLLRPGPFQQRCPIAGQSLHCSAARSYSFPSARLHTDLFLWPFNGRPDLQRINGTLPVWCHPQIWWECTVQIGLFGSSAIIIAFFLVARNHEEFNLKSCFITLVFLAVTCIRVVDSPSCVGWKGHPEGM